MKQSRFFNATGEVVEWNTRQPKELMPIRLEGSSPSLSTKKNILKSLNVCGEFSIYNLNKILKVEEG